METERDFKGVWIPKEIWLDDNLGWSAKMLLVEIDSLAKNGECFATNEYFGKFFGLSKDRISKLIAELKNKGYIEVKLIYKQGSKQIDKRLITTTGYRQKHLQGIGENNDTPVGENNYDNNTSINNTINNTSNKREKSIDYQAIVNAYKEICISLPACRTLSESRKKAIRARIRSGYALNDFITMFTKAQQSDFLTGGNGRNWTANFDWLIKDSNMAKVLDGNYDNRTQNTVPIKEEYHIPGLIEL